MKFSLNWIKRYANLPADLSMEKLAYDLTMCTVEVEGVHNIGESLAGLVVGKILTVEKHPDADKLRLCSVDIGAGEPSQIVCGGVNLAPNQLVAVAVPGAMVRWHGEGEPVEIKPAKLRGVMSCGMICASGEIGLAELFPTTQPAEIMDLTEFGARPGTPLAEALGLDDVILEVDNKSMTNRPDLWGHYGMARELAAIYGCALEPIAPLALPEMSEALSVKILDEERCARYIGFIIKGIKNIPSPFELKSMLWRVGQRPINLPVDITNYVMLACGQPTHGFDRKHIEGGIVVRRAHEGEQLVLLDGETLNLTAEDLVIADEKSPVGLAGVMGGKLDSILEETTELILEIANFSPLGIRRTSQRFDLRTEASSRYEKGLDPQRVDEAAAVALAAFKEYFPQSEVAACSDIYPRPLDCAVVEVPLDFLRKRLGRDLLASEVTALLDRLGFKTEERGELLRVTAPSWRSTGDISLPDDILEEVARLVGYVNFPFIAPTVTLDKAINQRVPQLERAIREYLAFRCNMQEIFTYPWIKESFINASGAQTEEMLELSTPPAPEERHLRSTLVPGLLEAVATNLGYFPEFRIFELTQVFFDRNYQSLNSEDELLPEMARHLSAAFVGSDARKLFREAKGVLEHMRRAVQMEPLAFVQSEKPNWADDNFWVNVAHGGEIIGSLALVSPKSAKSSGIKRSQAAIFEIDVEKLIPLPSRQNEFVHLPVYPLSDFDLSVVFDESIAWRDIEETARKVEFVRDVQFIDEYRGKQIGSGKKSISFRVWVGSDNGTLTSEQIENAAKQAAKKISKKFGGEVRGAQ